MRVRVISADRNNWGINTTVQIVDTGETLTVNVDPWVAGTINEKLLAAITEKQSEDAKVDDTETALKALIGKETEIGVAQAEPIGE